MINNSEFAKRLTIIMDYFQISASVFADRIQVPRSSISHLLSGRNKPSLDFVMKVIKEFEEVELYWLLNGKGEFPKTETSPSIRSNRHIGSKIDVSPEESFVKKMHQHYQRHTVTKIKNTSDIFWNYYRQLWKVLYSHSHIFNEFDTLNWPQK